MMGASRREDSLARDLDHAHRVACDLVRKATSAADLARVYARLPLSESAHNNYDLETASYFGRVHENAQDLAELLEQADGLVLDRACSLLAALKALSNSPDARGRGGGVKASVITLERILDRISVGYQVSDHISADVGGVAARTARQTTADEPGIRKIPTPMANRMLATAARVLPPENQRRYEDEFKSELAEIASNGGSRRRQFMYAARQLIAAWPLRSELLRVPKPRGIAS
jgi:hypothetical protein